jgi:predicted secreted protein
MSNADIGFGAVFSIGATIAGPFTAVAEVTQITPPGMSRDAVEVTHLTSLGEWKQFIAGLKDGGEAQLTFNYVAAANDAILTAFNANTGAYQITFPNGVMMRFAGFFTGYTPPELTPGNAMQASATIKVTGAPTLHAAS